MPQVSSSHLILPPFPSFFLKFLASSLFTETERKLPRGLPTCAPQGLLISPWASLVRGSVFPAGSETQHVPEGSWE